MVRGEDRTSVSLNVLRVSELTWHSDAVARLLSDTHTGKVAFPPLPFFSRFLLLHSTYSESGRHVALVSSSIGHTNQSISMTTG